MPSTSVITEKDALESSERLAAQWLHSNDGVIYLAFGDSLSEELQKWWKDVLAYTDQLIEPEFALVSADDPLNQCTLEQVDDQTISGAAGIYQSPRYTYSIGTDGSYYNFRRTGPGKIVLAQSAYTHAIRFADSQEAGWKTVAFHELGHALGLEHPHDFADGDGDSIIDTNATIMSYNKAIDLDGDPGFTSLDVEGLSQIHGAESGGLAVAKDGHTLLHDAYLRAGFEKWKTPSLTTEFVGGNIVKEPASEKTLKQLRLTRYNGNTDNGAVVNLKWSFGDGLYWHYNEGFTQNFHDITLDDAFSVEFKPGQIDAFVDIWVIANPQEEADETLEVTLVPARDPDYFISIPNQPLKLTITESDRAIGKYQQIEAKSDVIVYRPGRLIDIPLYYSTSDNDPRLAGLKLNFHYDSKRLSPLGENNGITDQLAANAVTATSSENDAADSDQDPLTDSILQLNWASVDNTFPGTELPAQIGTANFTTSSDAYDPVTGAPVTTTVNFTAAETANNYGFEGTPVTLVPEAFHLDIDGDGKTTALGDGLMVIRKLFGSAFAGDALTNKAASANATVDTQAMHHWLEAGIASDKLDVDQDGKTTALGDGLMIIRHMFGTAFAGDALIDKAISNSSPYAGQSNAADLVSQNIEALKGIAL